MQSIHDPAWLAGVQTYIPAHTSAQHHFDVCLLAPGLYSLYSYDVQLQLKHESTQSNSNPVQPHPDGVTAISPAYLVAE